MTTVMGALSKVSMKNSSSSRSSSCVASITPVQKHIHVKYEYKNTISNIIIAIRCPEREPVGNWGS